MALSQVDICNAALVKIGQDIPISAMAENTKAARVFNRSWDRVLDLVLAEHPWPFTIKAVALAQQTDDPPPGWSYRYALPADCLTALAVCDESGVRPILSAVCNAPWESEAMSSRFGYPYDVQYGDTFTSVLSDYEGAYLIYSARMAVSDIGRFPPLFCEAVACRLAVEVAQSLAGELGNRIGQGLMQAYEIARAKAIAHAFNQSVESTNTMPPSVAARGGY